MAFLRNIMGLVLKYIYIGLKSVFPVEPANISYLAISIIIISIIFKVVLFPVFLYCLCKGRMKLIKICPL